MKVLFGIREKFALVAIVLVVLSAILLRRYLFKGTSDIVVEHELVDLQDEGDLRCWNIVDSVNYLRDELAITAAFPNRLEDGLAVLNMHAMKIETPPDQELVVESEHFSEGNVLWWETILSVRTIEVSSGKLIESHFEPSIEIPDPPEYLIESLKKTKASPPVGAEAAPADPADPADPANPAAPEVGALISPAAPPVVGPAEPTPPELPEALVSPLFGLDLPVGYLATRKAPEELADEEHNIERVPVMWGVCRIPQNPDTALAILLPVGAASSPRHLTFLFNDTGHFLQHPIPRKDPKPGERDVEEVYEGITLLDKASSIAKKKNGYAGSDMNRQVQRGELIGNLENPVPVSEATPFFYVQGTASHALQEAIWEQTKDPTRAPKEFDEILWNWKLNREMADLHVRFGGPNPTSRSFRMLAHSEDAIESAKEFVAEHYAERYPGVKNLVEWHPGIRHASADVYLGRFRLGLKPNERPGGLTSSDPYYFFCFAAFREELAFSVGSEFEKLKKDGAILAVVSGLAAFLVALFFVRPLRSITKTAQQVTAPGSDSGELQHKIEEVRRSLPVRKRDEVGDIARALESLLRQVLNGHEQLRQLNADLDGKVREQTQELREANDELRGLAAAKDEFLASVSHELRQPLNSIFGYLQFLEMSDLDEEQRGDVEKTHMAAKYLHRLINDILDYQKIIMGGMELEPAEFDAAEFFENVRDSMVPQAAERGNKLVFEGTDKLGTLVNDRNRLQQILVNLISNACKFTGDGTVTVKGERLVKDGSPDRVIIKVTDTGRGMKPEEKEQLFVKFKKLAAREGNKTGTGLGLVICKGLTELMHGSIGCESEYGKGTSFTINLPASVSESEEALKAEPVKKAAKRVASSPLTKPTARPLVLVIDDDETVCSLMNRFLTSHGYDVVHANDGQRGIDLAKERKPSVITLDVVLPGRDGWEVLSELKSDPATSDIPVVMVTFIEEKTHGYTLGADDYLVKPVDWEDFSRRIKRVLGREVPNGEDPETILVVDDDADTRTLFRRTLEQDGMKVREAENGEKALDSVKEHKPDTIVLDLMMPVMDGFEFVESLRANPDWRDIPIIVVTAKSTSSDDRQRLEGGVRAILNKGGSHQDHLLGDILALVHRHAPHNHGEDKDSSEDGKDFNVQEKP